ncbi:MAG: hypothetical protein J6R49_03940 [Clostridia bacterium]|nr:hypothetical protein [Clostridia bacterium]
MFRRFFIGRYGSDQLNFALIVASLVCGGMTLITYGVAEMVFSLLQFALLTVWCLRAFSRNHRNRSIENQKFLRFWRSFKEKNKWLFGFFSRLADRKHVYFKCPSCKSRLRVPRGRGNITVTCPRCRHSFDKKS